MLTSSVPTRSVANRFSVGSVLPWIGVMALGYVLGGAFRRTAEERRVEFVVIGAAMIVVFVLLRAAAIYGDPAPWLDGPRAALGFLRTTKYPPSLQFVLMTIGPGLIALALIDRLQGVVIIVAFFFQLDHAGSLQAVGLKPGERFRGQGPQTGLFESLFEDQRAQLHHGCGLEGPPKYAYSRSGT